MFIGFGALAGPSRMRMPRPPQNSTTFMSHHLEGRNGEYQTAAPLAYIAQLLADLGSEVPRQHEDIVGAIDRDSVRVVDRNVRTRKEPALLVWTAVDRVRDQVRPDAAVVEQRVSLARSAVPD